ncbi:MAG: hypothetical protein DMF00_09160 [Verrucomicrobia bacterium]|nr:MAG: hypothetical protein DMF00_09160 [Verrucomicrobiota bacterium]
MLKPKAFELERGAPVNFKVATAPAAVLLTRRSVMLTDTKLICSPLSLPTAFEESPPRRRE